MKDELNTIIRMMEEIIAKCDLDAVKYPDKAWTSIEIPGVSKASIYFNENRKVRAFVCEDIEYSHYSGKIKFHKNIMNDFEGFQKVIESLRKVRELVFKGPAKRKLNFN